MIFLYFTIYLILISWLAWYINKPKTGGIVCNSVYKTQLADLNIEESAMVFYLIGQTGIKTEEAFAEPVSWDCKNADPIKDIQNLKNAIDKALKESS